MARVPSLSATTLALATSQTFCGEQARVGVQAQQRGGAVGGGCHDAEYSGAVDSRLVERRSLCDRSKPRCTDVGVVSRQNALNQRTRTKALQRARPDTTRSLPEDAVDDGAGPAVVRR
jgi:hypothetical protein